MPKLSGIEVAARSQKLTHPPGVIILSVHGDESYIMRALAAGARAYLLKSATDENGRFIRFSAWTDTTPYGSHSDPLGLTAAARHLAPDISRRRRKLYVSGISDGWLRCYEVESAKHADDR
jgi:CheY-like chemotaxis protein